MTKEGTCLLPVFSLVSGDPLMTVAECSDGLATMKGHKTSDELCFTGLWALLLVLRCGSSKVDASNKECLHEREDLESLQWDREMCAQGHDETVLQVRGDPLCNSVNPVVFQVSRNTISQMVYQNYSIRTSRFR